MIDTALCPNTAWAGKVLLSHINSCHSLTTRPSTAVVCHAYVWLFCAHAQCSNGSNPIATTRIWCLVCTGALCIAKTKAVTLLVMGT